MVQRGWLTWLFCLLVFLDELVQGGTVITDVGLVHFYRDPDIDMKGFALAFVVLDELTEKVNRKR